MLKKHEFDVMTSFWFCIGIAADKINNITELKLKL